MTLTGPHASAMIIQLLDGWPESLPCFALLSCCSVLVLSFLLLLSNCCFFDKAGGFPPFFLPLLLTLAATVNNRFALHCKSVEIVEISCAPEDTVHRLENFPYHVRLRHSAADMCAAVQLIIVILWTLQTRFAPSQGIN